MPHVYGIEIYSYYYLDVYFAYGGVCCLVSKSCPTLWPRGLHMPGFPVHHSLPEFAQTYVHWVSNAYGYI